MSKRLKIFMFRSNLNETWALISAYNAVEASYVLLQGGLSPDEYKLRYSSPPDDKVHLFYDGG